ncbi:MAG: phosphoribosylanthranilate isomerase [bacterium]|nr:phosphoribosylanthranilate isomerase [bacterium]
MKTKVKFCGMTCEEDIAHAEDLGVDFIGFIFVDSSPRSVSMYSAKELRTHVSKSKTVGVFMNHSNEEIENYVKEVDLDYIQLHGEPSIDRIQHLSKPVIQAFRGIPDKETAEAFLQHCPYILIDKANGQSEADFEAIAGFPVDIRSKLFLAGGLTPGNVRPVVDRIQPFAVDCARGIESEPGKKNANRMLAFFQALS